MILKITTYFLFVFYLSSCSNWLFVYSQDEYKRTISSLYQNTSLDISGTDISIIKSLLNKKIGRPKKSKYRLSIISNKKEINLVTQSNQVVTLVKIQHNFSYSFFSKENNCVVMEKNIVTEGQYNAKSNGYSFGSDLSKAKINDDLIEENINDFLSMLTGNKPNLECS